MYFKFVKFLGSLGFFTYTGAYGCQSSWYPLARVKYADGDYGMKMPIGNACNYAKIFGGEVVRPDSGS